MKGGVAVALELVRDLALAEPGPYDVALLLFGKEELPAQFSPLPDLFERSQLAPAADLAILLEPTDLTIQAGCLGNMNARVTFSGVSGHSARPWTAENAIDKAIDGPRPDRSSRAARGDRGRAAVLRGRLDHPARGGHRRPT